MFKKHRAKAISVAGQVGEEAAGVKTSGPFPYSAHVGRLEVSRDFGLKPAMVIHRGGCFGSRKPAYNLRSTAGGKESRGSWSQDPQEQVETSP